MTKSNIFWRWHLSPKKKEVEGASKRSFKYQNPGSLPKTFKLEQGWKISTWIYHFDATRIQRIKDTIYKLWKREKESSTNPLVLANINTRKRNAGRKTKDISELQERVAAISIGNRTSLRNMEMKSGISRSTLYRAVQAG